MSVNQFFSLISRIMQKDYSEIAYFTFTYFPQKVHSSETILEGNSPQSQQTARALVQWLCDETRKLKVVRSNPSTVYWMGIFALICCQNFIDVCLKMTKNKRKRGRGWTIFFKKNTTIAVPHHGDDVQPIFYIFNITIGRQTPCILVPANKE